MSGEKIEYDPEEQTLALGSACIPTNATLGQLEELRKQYLQLFSVAETEASRRAQIQRAYEVVESAVQHGEYPIKLLDSLTILIQHGAITNRAADEFSDYLPAIPYD